MDKVYTIAYNIIDLLKYNLDSESWDDIIKVWKADTTADDALYETI